MNFFIFFSLAISVVLGIPESDLSIVTPLIGGVSEFPAIDSVSFFFPLCNLYADYYLLIPSVSLDGLLW